MIALRRVSKSYRAGGTTKVLMRDVSLTLPRGRSVGLLGRNGAGKSTLLRMIGGSILPDSGEIVREANVSWPLGFGGGFHASLTGAQNARFVARIYGVDTNAMVEIVRDFAELGEFLHMPVSTYSSGMRARLAFGVSMAIDFDVYLVDEITSVGDAAFRRKCTEAFAAKTSVADIVMVSHSPGVIKEYCDSAVVLENGTMTYYSDLDAGLAAHDENMKRPPQH